MKVWRITGELATSGRKQGRKGGKKKGIKALFLCVWHMYVFMFACVYSRACMQMYIDAGVLR